MRTRACALGLVLAAGVACGGTPARPPTDIRIGHDLRVEGMLGVPVPATLAAGVLSVPVTVDGVSGPPLLIDSGSPITYVDPALFPSAGIAAGAMTLAHLGVGPATVDNVPAVGFAVLGPGAPLGGLLGANVICQFAASFDYKNDQFALGAVPSVAGVQAEVDAPFRLLGGGFDTFPGLVQSVPFPATRIVLTVRLDGVDRTFAVDTGSSFVVLTPAVFQAVTADGRATLDLNVIVPGGIQTQRVTRLRSIVVGGAEVDAIPAMTLSDNTLASVSLETGVTLDGLVGVSFLRQFMVTLDYPHTVMRLRRYTDESHVSDEFQRVGFGLGETSAGFRVVQVFAGTDAAAQGVTTGTTVLSVDGQTLAGMEATAADRLLRGTPGSAHTVAFSDRTRTLRVDELLPLP